MDQATRDEADRRFEGALERTGSRDPRDFYRKTLLALRNTNPPGYDRAVKYFKEHLVPTIASGQEEPLHAWREYGRLLAEATAEGRTLAIDASGLARPYESDTPLSQLVLHLPADKRARALLVALPPELSGPQRATYDLLVRGSQAP